ncbi:putative D-tyrosyl-tRNA(Tyr) deacylase [Diplonema papillatum]|nr:putative D-tyrosyl-tRNA(Tyr) deacylase [Diplonema papillatum]
MALRVILQSVEKGSLLVNNVDQWVDISRGVIVYVCFLKGANEVSTKKAANDVLNAKIFPHVNEESLERGRVSAALVENWDVMVVPQATLAGRLKGKQAQYHAQFDKTAGAELYELFCSSLRTGIETYDRGDRPTPTLQCGVYGNRQGLKFESLGPFTHALEF